MDRIKTINSPNRQPEIDLFQNRLIKILEEYYTFNSRKIMGDAIINICNNLGLNKPLDIIEKIDGIMEEEIAKNLEEEF